MVYVTHRQEEIEHGPGVPKHVPLDLEGCEPHLSSFLALAYLLCIPYLLLAGSTGGSPAQQRSADAALQPTIFAAKRCLKRLQAWAKRNWRVRVMWGKDTPSNLSKPRQERYVGEA